MRAHNRSLNLIASSALARTAIGLCLLLALAGCGRRGSLEPAPDANAPAAAAPAAGESDPVGAQLPKRKKVKKITPPQRETALDWLL